MYEGGPASSAISAPILTRACDRGSMPASVALACSSLSSASMKRSSLTASFRSVTLYSSTCPRPFDTAGRAGTSPLGGEVGAQRCKRGIDQPELDRPLDRLAAAGCIEFPVHRDCLGLHGVAGDEEALG